jgi:septal ring-binding cell division protein DamX
MITFALSKKNTMAVFGVIVALFVLAIASAWFVPNKSISDNEHDIKF